MPLTITWLHKEPAPVWANPLGPDRLAAIPAQDIPRLPVRVGNTPIPLGDLAKIEGDPSDNSLILQGSLAHLHCLGQSMAWGNLRILGNRNESVGHYLGSNMSGGSILLEGSAGHWTGSDMLGGLIDIRGNTGDYLGAASPGRSSGMRNGTILVHGDAGHHAALRMRRGLIAIRGSTGLDLARSMIAGSVFVFGSTGPGPGASMRRGTLLLLNHELPELLPTFPFACRYNPVFLALYLRHLRCLGFPLPDGPDLLTLNRHIGDRLENGQGEILLPAQ